MRVKNGRSKSDKPKTRKELRKDKRKEKKVKRHDYYTNRNQTGKLVLNPEKNRTVSASETKPSAKNKKQTEQSPQKKEKQAASTTSNELTVEKARAKEKRDQQKLQLEMNRQRNKQLIDANEEEDKTIRRLEKQLKLNKRKSKSVPKSFAEDGLDYLLEVCDSKTMQGAVMAEQQLNEANDDFDEDFELMTAGEKTKKSTKNSLKRNIAKTNKPSKKTKLEQDEDLSELESDESHSNDDSLFSKNEDEINEEEEDDFSDNELTLNEEDSSDEKNDSNSDDEVNSDDFDKDTDLLPEKQTSDETDKKNVKQQHADGTWEDIYGRLRSKDGSIITTSEKYIPPAIRAKMEAKSDDKAHALKLERLRKQLQGSLNKLAESNMHSIATSIEELYMNNSRNDMNQTMTSLIVDALVTNTLSPERLLMEHVLLITVLHANVGSEVGAHFLQTIVHMLDVTLKSSEKRQIENKILDNLVNIIAQLYNFKLFDAKLIYEILAKLSDGFEEKDVECILHILRSVGFGLRKDNPLELKNLIMNLQKRAADAREELKDNARVKFMLDILLAIKNNNVTKIPNYDTSHSEHLKKIMKGLLRKGNYVSQLNISLDDLLKADERGRWWVVGSAWAGNENKNTNDDATINSTTNSFSQTLLALAKKQRMNTDTRRNIFCIIMSAEDYLDAFEKLLRLSLRNQQEREIIHVILHCCLQEIKYNPYYAFLAQKFCEYDRRYQMTIKYSIWDKLKALGDHSATQISNLAKLLTHLFMEKGIPISTLKVVQFGELDKTTLRFMRQILLGILLHDNIDEVQEVFDKVAQSDKLRMFRESLRLFIHHFLLRNLNSQSVAQEKKDLLQERAKIIEKVLTRKSNNF